MVKFNYIIKLIYICLRWVSKFTCFEFRLFLLLMLSFEKSLNFLKPHSESFFCNRKTYFYCPLSSLYVNYYPQLITDN